LKLKADTLLSNFAFDCNLGHYDEEEEYDAVGEGGVLKNEPGLKKPAWFA